MSEDKPQTPPDRVSVNPRNPHFDQASLERGIGIRRLTNAARKQRP